MNHRITGPDSQLDAEPGESVLDACRRAGKRLPFGCRAGICLKCLMRLDSGAVPSDAQASFGPDVASRGLFLPCRCVPVEDISFSQPAPDHLRDLCRIEVADVDELGPRLLLRPLQPRRVRTGQRLHFLLEPGLDLAGHADTDPDEDLLLGLRLDGPSAVAVRGRVRGLVHRLIALREGP